MIQVRCPQCSERMALKRKKCACGADIAKAKNNGRTKYVVAFRLPGPRQLYYETHKTLAEAKAVETEKNYLKARGRASAMLPATKTNFQQLS